MAEAGSDQKRWFKLYASLLTDQDILLLDTADRWRWVALALYTNIHGKSGRIEIDTRHPVLAAAMSCAPGKDLEDAIFRLPKVSVERVEKHPGKIIVTFRKWVKYQHDDSAKRKRMSRSRGEESRVEEIREEINSNSGVKAREPTQPVLLKPAPKPCGCQQVLDELNRLRAENRVGRRALNLVGEGARFLHARHQEASIDDCLHVVRVMVGRWAHDSERRDHLTLDTLFRPGNFDKYLARDIPVAAPPNGHSNYAARAAPEKAPTHAEWLVMLKGMRATNRNAFDHALSNRSAREKADIEREIDALPEEV